MLALIEAPESTSLRGLRDRAMLSVAYAAGLRVSEIVGLKLGDLDLQRGIVAALGKGGKRRLVPLGEVSIAHLEAYLDAREKDEARRRSKTGSGVSARCWTRPPPGGSTDRRWSCSTPPANSWRCSRPSTSTDMRWRVRAPTLLLLLKAA